MISPVNLQGLTLTLVRNWSSAILLDTLYNFFNNLWIYFSCFVFFGTTKVLRVELFDPPSEIFKGRDLTCGFKTKSANEEKEEKKEFSSLLQVLNVKMQMSIFHLLLYVGVHCVFTHCGLWLLLQ